MKKKIISTMSLLLLLCILVMNVSALEAIDMNQAGSISITMTYQGETVAGGSLTLYRVADVHVERGADYSYRYTEDYEDCGASLDDLNSSQLARDLAAYTESSGISGRKTQISDEGLITFSELELGLYLLVQENAAEGFEKVNPFLVSVPGMRDGSYIYDVDATPKLSLEPAPTEPNPPTEPTEPTEPPPPNLPQTGLNQWPVPVLAISGLLLVVLGLVIYTTGKKRAHES